MSIKITDWVVGESTTELTVEWKASDVIYNNGLFLPMSYMLCVHLHTDIDDELIYYAGAWSEYVTYSGGMVVYNKEDGKLYKAVGNTAVGVTADKSGGWEVVKFNHNIADDIGDIAVDEYNPVYMPLNTIHTIVIYSGFISGSGTTTIELSNADYGDCIVTVSECYVHYSEICNTYEEAYYADWQWINNTSEGYVVGQLRGAGTTYDILVSGGEEPPIETTVEKWDWYSTNVNATAGETEEAYNALLTLDAVELFRYTVWNDLVDKTNEIIEALGGEWSTASTVDGSTYLSLEDSKMSEGDSKLTYHRFNSWRFNIGSRFSTEGVIDKPIKDEGDVVSAGDFLALAEHINTWIDEQL